MVVQVCGPDAKGVTWPWRGVSASSPPGCVVHQALACPGRECGRCRAGQGRAQASSFVCPEVPPAQVVWVSHPALGGAPTAPSSLCGFLVLNGRGLQRLQQAVECEPGWGHWRWVESRDGWP